MGSKTGKGSAATRVLQSVDNVPMAPEAEAGLAASEPAEQPKQKKPSMKELVVEVLGHVEERQELERKLQMNHEIMQPVLKAIYDERGRGPYIWKGVKYNIIMREGVYFFNVQSATKGPINLDSEV